ncbi:MAG: NADH-quinone oxidoreductase subunit L [Deltaproteobacteria bacterium RBG_16_54_18]|nr:MAG: NADH-quinone oxidoreductase subunit L [Deltaproteobacteria bacterium RBG_16_54_18]
MIDWVWLIPLFPAAGFLVNGLFGRWMNFDKRVVAWTACSALGLSFVFSVLVFFSLLQLAPEARAAVPDRVLFDWIVSGDFRAVVGYKVDPLSIIMALVVSGVSFFIHIYSVGYMHDDPGFTRYFAFLNLFVFMMLTLVLANNFLLMFVGWEGVGLCSYLLIGFWFDRDAPANAGKKAFVVNRIGDFGFLVGIFLIFAHLGTVEFTGVFAKASTLDTTTVTIITLMLFLGAAGKSAQIPLYVWLPDAMEGPTPVSSLIHAATMVTSGVYMIARCHVLYTMAPITMATVAIVGAATAIFAASMGLLQFDIKRVLAYSTISQLGYMFLAVGVGAFSAGIFHLMTHAFFKGLLFLGAGSVMHAMSGELDMRNMGGIWKRIPITFWTFVIATLAIAGIPGLAGFFSKDEILWQTYNSGHRYLWLVGAAAAGMTAFYMFRLLFVTFLGKCRASDEVKKHIHESPAIMTIPLIVLAVLSVIGGYVGIPHVLGGRNFFDEFLAPVLGGPPLGSGGHTAFSLVRPAFAAGGLAEEHGFNMEIMLMAVSVAIAVIGIGIAFYLYLWKTEVPKRLGERLKGLYRLVFNKYYVDELYEACFVTSTKRLGTFLWREFDDGVIDRSVNLVARLMLGIAGVLRRIQSGRVQGYALGIILGAVIIILFLIR